MRRRARIVPVVLVFVAVASCEKFEHVNPYDPAVPVTIVVSGPDTLFSYNELGVYSAQSTPAFPDTSFKFGTVDSTVFFPSGTHGFTSMKPPLYPLTQTVRLSASIGQIDTTLNIQVLGIPASDCPTPPAPCNVKVTTKPSVEWRHSGYLDVVLTQRITHIQLRCPTAHACDTMSTGGVWSVWADGLDALNYKVLALSGVNANPAPSDDVPAIATFALRDTTIGTLTPVGVRVANVTALKPGSTWIVATRGALTDSLQLVVH